MSVSTTRCAALVGLFAVCIACNKPAPPPPDQIADATERDPERMRPQHPMNSRPGETSLPPESVALREVMAELERRASLGDARASCRVAAEYDNCAALHEQLMSIDATLKGGRSKSAQDQRQITKTAVGELESVAGLLLEKADHCEGISVPNPGRRIEHWRNAATGGHIPSMVMYSTGRVFRTKDTLDNLDQLRRYKNEALQFATRAAAAGSGEAILALAVAYTPRGSDMVGSNLLAQALAPNPEEALTLYYLLQSSLETDTSADATTFRRNIEKRIHRLVDDLPQDSVVRADREASRRRRSWARIGSIQDVSATAAGFGLNQETSLCAKTDFVDQAR